MHTDNNKKDNNSSDYENDREDDYEYDFIDEEVDELDDKYIYPSLSAFYDCVMNMCEMLEYPVEKLNFFHNTQYIKLLIKWYISIIKDFDSDIISLAILDTYYLLRLAGVKIFVISKGRRGSKTGSFKSSMTALVKLYNTQPMKVLIMTLKEDPDLKKMIKTITSILEINGIQYTKNEKLLTTENNMEIYFVTGGSRTNRGRGESYHYIVIDEASRIPELYSLLTDELLPTIMNTNGIILLTTTPKMTDAGSLINYIKKHSTETKLYIAPTFFNNFVSPNDVLDAMHAQDDETIKIEYLGIPNDNESKLAYQQKWFYNFADVSYMTATKNQEYEGSLIRAKDNPLFSLITIDIAETASSKSDYTAMIHLSVNLDEMTGNFYFFIKDYLRERVELEDRKMFYDKFVYKASLSHTNLPGRQYQDITLKDIYIEAKAGYAALFSTPQDRLNPEQHFDLKQYYTDKKIRVNPINLHLFSISKGSNSGMMNTTIAETLINSLSKEVQKVKFAGDKGIIAMNAAELLGSMYKTNRIKLYDSKDVDTPIVIWDLDHLNTWTDKPRKDFDKVKEEIYNFAIDLSHQGQNIHDDVVDALNYAIINGFKSLSAIQRGRTYKKILNKVVNNGGLKVQR